MSTKGPGDKGDKTAEDELNELLKALNDNSDPSSKEEKSDFSIQFEDLEQQFQDLTKSNVKSDSSTTTVNQTAATSFVSKPEAAVPVPPAPTAHQLAEQVKDFYKGLINELIAKGVVTKEDVEGPTTQNRPYKFPEMPSFPDLTVNESNRNEMIKQYEAELTRFRTELKGWADQLRVRASNTEVIDEMVNLSRVLDPILREAAYVAETQGIDQNAVMQSKRVALRKNMDSYVQKIEKAGNFQLKTLHVTRVNPKLKTVKEEYLKALKRIENIANGVTPVRINDSEIQFKAKVYWTLTQDVEDPVFYNALIELKQKINNAKDLDELSDLQDRFQVLSKHLEVDMPGKLEEEKIRNAEMQEKIPNIIAGITKPADDFYKQINPNPKPKQPKPTVVKPVSPTVNEAKPKTPKVESYDPQAVSSMLLSKQNIVSSIQENLRSYLYDSKTGLQRTSKKIGSGFFQFNLNRDKDRNDIANDLLAKSNALMHCKDPVKYQKLFDEFQKALEGQGERIKNGILVNSQLRKICVQGSEKMKPSQPHTTDNGNAALALKKLK